MNIYIILDLHEDGVSKGIITSVQRDHELMHKTS